MDVVNTQLTPLQTFQTVFHRFPKALISASLLGLASPWLIGNYFKWRSLPRSALPQNPFGWLIALSVKPFGRETLSTTEYDRDPIKQRWLNAATLPRRRGDRPKTGWHFLPHRQTSDLPTEEIRKKLDEIFLKHANANNTLVQLTRSPHEREVDAMLIHPSIQTLHNAARQNLREVAHVHPVDGSLHVTLSPQDCKLVIENGWGERHPLSGRAPFIPLAKESLLIYAPRDAEELETVEQIIVAAIGFMTGSRLVS